MVDGKFKDWKDQATTYALYLRSWLKHHQSWMLDNTMELNFNRAPGFNNFYAFTTKFQFDNWSRQNPEWMFDCVNDASEPEGTTLS